MAAPVPLRRNREFTLLWTGYAASALGWNIALTAYPLLVLALTESATAAGVVGFVAWLPYVLFAIPVGWLVDNVDRKRLLVLVGVGRALALASLVVAFGLESVTLPHVLAVAFVDGMLFVAGDLGELPAIRQVVGRGQLAAALSLAEGRARAALLVGRPLGGALFDVLRSLPFAVDALANGLAAAAVAFIRTPLQDERLARERRMLHDVVEGAVWLWRQPFLRLIPALSLGVNALFQGLVLLIIVAARDVGASATLIGAILGIGGAGGIAGAVAAPFVQRAVPAKRILVGAIWLWALVLPALAVTTNPYALALVFGVMSFAGPIWNVASASYALTLTPDGFIGRVQGVARLVALAGIPIGSLLSGLLLDAAGPGATALTLAAAMLGIAALATASRAVRRAPDLREST